MSSLTNLSPGVVVNEIDLSASIPNVGASGGAFVGQFQWGPVLQYNIISDVDTLLATYGKPNDVNFVDWFSASNFLAYTGNLNLIRVVDSAALNAVDGTNPGILINNSQHFQIVSSAPTGVAFAAKYPGTLGNSILVSLADKNTFAAWAYASEFDTAPGTSEAAAAVGAIDDELHVIVIDSLGKFTGVVGAVLEKFAFLSKATDSKDINNGPNFYKNKLNNQSKYIWALDTVTGTAIGPDTLGGAINAVNVTAGGSGYTTATSVTVTGSTGGTGAQLKANLINGVINAVNVTAGGTGYTAATVAFSGGGGTGATGTVTITTGAVTAIAITNGGSGYTGTINVAISGDGTGATATATAVNGVIGSISIVNPGSQYAGTITVAISGAGTGATATATATATSSSTGTAWNTPFLVGSTASQYAVLQSQYVKQLQAGADSTLVGASELIAGYEMFENVEQVDVSLIFSGQAGGPAFATEVNQWIIDNVVTVRKDCILFLSPNLQDVLNLSQSDATAAITATRNTLNRSTSYAVMDSGWKLQYDIYNDKFRWIPLNSDLAGLCAQVDSTNDPWWSPAGYSRGNIKNAVSLAFNPNKTSRDNLYKIGINPVVTFTVDGTILYGDKTLQGKQSAFSYIGIRRLFILLEKAISRAAKYSLFKFNDQFTRAAFVNMVDPFLRQVKGRRGMDSYKVVCDETNNTPEVIMNGEFVGSIFIKPQYSIQTVTLNFVAVRRDVSFSEVVGQV